MKEGRWKINAFWLSFWLGVLWGLIIVLIIGILNSCEVSYIYIDGHDNQVTTEQVEDSIKSNINFKNK